MTETQKKALALALLNEVCAEMGLDKVSSLELDMPGERALVRAIEQHEAYKQEVSERDERLGEALYGLSARLLLAGFFENKEDHAAYERVVEAFGKPFIVAKPDPLVEVMQEWWDADGYASIETFRAALAARGLEIREKQP